MEYKKSPLSFEQQADQLIVRGLIADRDKLIERLKRVNYYRLSGYLYPFRQPDNTYLPGTTLEKICRRYTFDRQMRLLVLDGIERVEIAVRTDLVYQFVHQYGPFGYCEAVNLPHLSQPQHHEFIERINKEKNNGREVFVKHFTTKYGDNHDCLPMWMAAEIMSFGTFLTFFRGVEKSIKQAIAGNYNISQEVLHSWLGAINAVRNICAHHGRLWNRELGFKPLVPRENKHPQWHNPVEVPDNRIFGILTILKYMLNIVASQSKWPERVKGLLDKYADIPSVPMGFPENWQECPIWKDA
ncbi:Abi family protein [bacterium]|nr:Abi family protein [bacterium]